MKKLPTSKQGQHQKPQTKYLVKIVENTKQPSPLQENKVMTSHRKLTPFQAVCVI
jgi:hypothetical protein